MAKELYYCPVCGKYLFEDGPGSYEICPICDWEDDLVQEENPDYRGGANHESLNEYKKKWEERNEENK